MITPHARERFVNAADDHQAMLAAFLWLQAALKQNAGWRHSVDPLGDQHEVTKGRIRRLVTDAILDAIVELYDDPAVAELVKTAADRGRSGTDRDRKGPIENGIDPGGNPC